MTNFLKFLTNTILKGKEFLLRNMSTKWLLFKAHSLPNYSILKNLV